MFLDIKTMDGNHLRYAYDLEIWHENSHSIYAVGMYGDEYRVNKKSGQVKCNGTVIANTCTYQVYC